MSDSGEITVPTLRCRGACKQLKPITEFYESELNPVGKSGGGRCKLCFRKRVDNANKRAGRQSMSFSKKELVWLRSALHGMLSVSDMHTFAKDPAHTSILRKIQDTVAKSNENIATVTQLHERRKR